MRPGIHYNSIMTDLCYNPPSLWLECAQPWPCATFDFTPRPLEVLLKENLSFCVNNRGVNKCEDHCDLRSGIPDFSVFLRKFHSLKPTGGERS